MVGSTFRVEAMAPGQGRNWQEEAEKEGTAVQKVGTPGRGLSRRVDVATRLSIVAMPRRKKVSVTKEVWEMFDRSEVSIIGPTHYHSSTLTQVLSLETFSTPGHSARKGGPTGCKRQGSEIKDAIVAGI